MPSPLGHALAAAATGWLLAPAPESQGAGRALVRQGLVFAALGMLPDLDLLGGGHRGPSHSLTASALVAAIAALAARSPRFGLAAGCAYATHTLLDWLGSDTSSPIGIMALWPWSREYYQSGAHLFGAISRRYWMDGFLAQNLRAVVWELVVLLPPTLVAWYVRTRNGKHAVNRSGPEV